MSPARLRVLLVEDNPGDADLARLALAEVPGRPFEVRATGTLSGALQVLNCERVDVVLLDLNLPDSVGHATLDWILAADPTQPVVVLTGIADEEAALDSVRRGAQDYLVKTDVLAPVLARSLRHAIERKRLSDELARANADYRSLVEQSEDGIVVLSPDGTVRYANAAAARLLGDDPEAGLEPLLEPAAPAGGRRLRSLADPGGGRKVELHTSPIEWRGQRAQLVVLREVPEPPHGGEPPRHSA